MLRFQLRLYKQIFVWDELLMDMKKKPVFYLMFNVFFVGFFLSFSFFSSRSVLIATFLCVLHIVFWNLKMGLFVAWSYISISPSLLRLYNF